MKAEIDKGNDELTEWANHQFHPFFLRTSDVDTLRAYREIMKWAQSQPQYNAAAKKAKDRILIPNVCEALQVPYVDTFEMMRRLGIRL